MLFGNNCRTNRVESIKIGEFVIFHYPDSNISSILKKQTVYIWRDKEDSSKAEILFDVVNINCIKDFSGKRFETIYQK